MEEKVEPLANDFDSLYDYGFHTQILKSLITPNAEKSKFKNDFAWANVIYREARTNIAYTNSMATILGPNDTIKEILKSKNGSDAYKILQRIENLEDVLAPSDRLSYLAMVIRVCEKELLRIKEEEKQEQPELGM